MSRDADSDHVSAGLAEGSRVYQWIQPRPLLGRGTTTNSLCSSATDATRC